MSIYRWTARRGVSSRVGARQSGAHGRGSWVWVGRGRLDRHKHPHNKVNHLLTTRRTAIAGDDCGAPKSCPAMDGQPVRGRGDTTHGRGVRLSGCGRRWVGVGAPGRCDVATSFRCRKPRRRLSWWRHSRCPRIRYWASATVYWRAQPCIGPRGAARSTRASAGAL